MPASSDVDFRLSPRLALAAELIPRGRAVADIGTDHAFLPAFLVREGVAVRAIAADVSEGPLRNAAQTVKALGIEDQVELRQSDGLDAFAPGDADCFVFAGMGGTLIARLLSRCPWINAPQATKIVAQPMRRSEDLRKWLMANGWRIEVENACFDAGRPYSALRATQSPAAQQSAGYTYYGELLSCEHPAAKMLLERSRRWLAKRIAGLEQCGRLQEERAQLRLILADLEERL